MKLNNLEDLTEDVQVEFACSAGRAERRFRLREQSRLELDHWYDLHEGADRELKERAEAIGAGDLRGADLVKAVTHLQWEHLAPVIAHVLREPIDGLPVPSLEEIRDGLNGRKALALIAKQEALDQTDLLKKKLEDLSKGLAALESPMNPPLPSGEPGTPSTTA